MKSRNACLIMFSLTLSYDFVKECKAGEEFVSAQSHNTLS